MARRAADFAIMAAHWGRQDRSVLITEFMASNGSAVPLEAGEILDGNGASSDWIELHNTSDHDLDIGGWYLTDEAANPGKWPFPPGTTIAAGGYLLVFASSKSQQDNPDNFPYTDSLGYLHTNFSLSRDGEYLALVRPNLSIAHEYASVDNGGGDYGYPEQERNISYGLYDDTERFFAAPTPAAANDPVYVDFVAPVEFSHKRGFYTGRIDVVLETATEGATIRWTTDGSRPDISNGTTYQGPIPVDKTTTLRAVALRAGWRPSPVQTHTYIRPDKVLTQRAPADYPTSWSGYPADYEMDPEIYDSSAYSSSMDAALRSLPVLSLVTEKDNFFGSNGIYTNPTASGPAWERPVSAEYFNTSDGREFQIDCGVRIYGGANRQPRKCPKHTLRLLFKSDYGPSKLDFPLFGDGAVNSFDTLILRGGYNNSWIHWSPGQRRRCQFIRDQWIRDSQLAMGQVSAHGSFVHLYINGLYWGLYNITERPQASFAAKYYGGEKEQWDALNSGAAVGESSTSSWATAQSVADTVNMSTTAGYEALGEHVDIPNLIDYMIVQLYGGNQDWDSHNWYAAKRRIDGEGFKFFSWDSERTLESPTGHNKTGIDTADKPSHFYARLK